jgi:4-diphosphocytidyl-2-C-methyl-D-erythritol kinase
MAANLISLEAPAKINLTLAVLGRRPDGFHQVESWIVKIAWHDKLTFEPSPRLEFKVIGDPKGLAADPSNLVIRAAETLAQDAGRSPAVSITLDKEIPSAPPGGGEAMRRQPRGLNQLWDLRRSTNDFRRSPQRESIRCPAALDEASPSSLRSRRAN